MNLTRCNHGHFYDMDKFESCPHCKNNGAGAAAEATVGLTGGTAGATEPYSGNAGDVTVPVGMTSPLDEVNTGLGKPIDATEEKQRQHSRRFLIQTVCTCQKSRFSEFRRRRSNRAIIFYAAKNTASKSDAGYY